MKIGYIFITAHFSCRFNRNLVDDNPFFRLLHPQLLDIVRDVDGKLAFESSAEVDITDKENFSDLFHRNGPGKVFFDILFNIPQVQFLLILPLVDQGFNCRNIKIGQCIHDRFQ
ncbi:hypothetical protein D3C77_447140 [compost metagenome]